MSRPDWDTTWMRVAADVARRSDCGVRRVGAVVVAPDNRDNWVGYNGPPAGFLAPQGPQDGLGCGNYCPQGREAATLGRWAPGKAPGPTRCVSVHAEVNALMQSDRRLRSGGTVYVTAAPCWKCALAIANSGARRLVCPPWELERDELAMHVHRLLVNTTVRITHPEDKP